MRISMGRVRCLCISGRMRRRLESPYVGPGHWMLDSDRSLSMPVAAVAVVGICDRISNDRSKG